MRLIQTVPPQATQTGTTTSGSSVVTGFSNTALLLGALSVSGTGISPGTHVASIDSATQMTLTQPATASGSVSLTFGVEPVSLAEAKKQVRVTYSDDDDYIANLIVAARMHCEPRLRQSFITQTWTLYHDSFPSAGGYYNRAIRESWPSLGGLPSGLGFYPGMVPNSTGVIDIPNPPLQSITAVQYYDFSGSLQTFPSSSYVVSLATPARIQPQYSKVWPISRPTIDSVQVTFVAGYGDTSDKIPEPIKAAMRLLIGTWYAQRTSVSEGTFMTVPDCVESLLASVDHGSYG